MSQLSESAPATMAEAVEPAPQVGVPFAVRTAVGLASVVIGANICGGLVITFLTSALNTTSAAGDRMLVTVVAGCYAAASVACGTIIGTLLHRRTLHWLARGTSPTRDEARRALRTPIDLALITAALWLLGSIVLGALAASLGTGLRQVVGLAGGIALSGLTTAGISYLLVGWYNRPIAKRALAAYPPQDSLMLSVRSRLLLIWLLTSGIPVLGIILVLAAPDRQSHVRGAAIGLGLVALAVGGFSTALAARSIGEPLRGLLDVLRRVGEGSLPERVTVDDAGEIGMLQDGVNEMVSGLRDRDRIHDLFGRHVGPAVAQEALQHGVTLSGESRDVVAVFVDITGSTKLTRTTDPRDFVAMLNRFFGIVVDSVEKDGGLVNKFEGDAALCVFGAPVELDDAATAALHSARRICTEVKAAGDVEIGVGVASGPVVAGQIGAASRLEYTVIGDAVNLAARLTELAKRTPEGVLAAGEVIAAAAPAERRYWREGEVVTLRGRDEPTQTFVVDPSGQN